MAAFLSKRMSVIVLVYACQKSRRNGGFFK